MKRFYHIIAYVLSLVLACGVLVALVGCSSTTTSPAATVNGVAISESEVDTYIASFRQGNQDLQSNAEWQDWLDSMGYTQEGFRLQVIDYLIEDKLIWQAANDNDITVDENQVDTQIAKVKDTYNSESAWQSALAENGYTEAGYRESIEIAYLTSQLKDQVVQKPTPTAAEFQDYANENASKYNGRRSSQIVFSTADLSTAVNVLMQLQAGADFATMARKYSIDTISAAKGGDVGWDSLNYFSNDYQNALDALEPGEFSGIVRTDYGYTIILCTDTYQASRTIAGVGVSNIPSEIRDSMETDLMATAWSDAFDSYINGLYDDASIVIFNEDGSVYTGNDGDNNLVDQSADDLALDRADNEENIGAVGVNANTDEGSATI